MPAPDSIKTELLRLLDEAYDNDGVAIGRVVSSEAPFVFYGDGAQPETLPTEQTYKLVVDASERENIRIRIRPATAPLVWPF